MRSSKVLVNVLISFTVVYILVFILAQLKSYEDNGGVRCDA